MGLKKCLHGMNGRRNIDDDRKKAYNFVKQYLNKDGQYIIASAGYSPEKDYSEDIRDKKTGIVYSRPLYESIENFEDAIVIDEISYVPSRRHYTIDELCNELKKFGLKYYLK